MGGWLTAGIAALLSATSAWFGLPAASSHPSAPGASTPPPSPVTAAYARLTPAQRIGQLFMVGVPARGADATQLAALTRHHVGNVILMHTSSAGVGGVAAAVAPVRRSTTVAGIGPYVAVDQEGGWVQHLQGPGFSTIPTALRQGKLALRPLRADWRTWGTQLRDAGINLDLAPVADVVPRGVDTPPIGAYDREYGHRVRVVAPHVAAAIRGLRDAGVQSAAKHFPGLGRASGNTDTTTRVTDPTTRHDPYLATFQRAVDVHVPFAMVSSAIYPNIDPGRIALFSRRIVTGMLRRQLGFDGVAITDSLTAVSLQQVGYAARATRSLRAGIDMLLLAKRQPVAAMESAIRQRMHADPGFAALVKRAVMRVLAAKAAAGLLP